MSFKRERGISLETLHWERASSRIEGRIPWFSSRFGRKFGVPLVLQCGPQGPTCIASGKSGLISSCNGHLGIPHKSLQGKYSSDRLVSINSVYLSNGTGISRLHSRFPWGVKPRLDLKQRTLLSSYNGYFLEPFKWP